MNCFQEAFRQYPISLAAPTSSALNLNYKTANTQRLCLISTALDAHSVLSQGAVKVCPPKLIPSSDQSQCRSERLFCSTRSKDATRALLALLLRSKRTLLGTLTLQSLVHCIVSTRICMLKFTKQRRQSTRQEELRWPLLKKQLWRKECQEGPIFFLKCQSKDNP